ncbi:laccase [Desarmillaria tabescens]|uniref:laccase n=1 Tax=Armillaria tabescens TaxID=1929756 RepID=A0AA39KE80_ARMTA|nr:laccase [Desarmillaria tabescens]KAK0457183.1 laccase [Desarmillaria tabescens]
MLAALVLYLLVEVSLGFEIVGPITGLEISNQYLAPDGFTRSTTVAGGTFPGPLIKGVKGDRFKIDVKDSLHDKTMLQSTSVHWHGIFQRGTNFADGTASVTQCPITSGDSFLYDFPVPDQAGTFWYHSHLSVQYCDGLRGPFVVYDGIDGVNDPHRELYDVDDESTIITLSDWYHIPTPELLKQPGQKRFNSTLINGSGRFYQDPTSALTVITVEPTKRYRLRIISMSCDPNYVFSIDGHDLTIIEADGENTVPHTVNALRILAGQRYSAILHAKQPVDNYWIRAQPGTEAYGFTGTPFESGINSAILRYVGAPEGDPTSTQQTPLVLLKEADLHALGHPGAPGLPFPGGADVVLNLTMGIDLTTGQFSINSVPFQPPSVPVLLQIMSGAQKAQDLLPQGSVYGLPLNKTIEINMIGGMAVGDPHPMHLHGHAFDVVKSADSDVTNYIDPVRRDVTSVLMGNTTTIRFVTDNPGPWFLHCHIDFHLEAGMAVVLAEATDEAAAFNPAPAAWDNLCPEYYKLSPDQL